MNNSLHPSTNPEILVKIGPLDSELPGLKSFYFKFDQVRSSNHKDYEGNYCNSLNKTATIGISHRTSRHVQDRSSPTFQHW